MKKNGKPHNSELRCEKCDRPVRAKGLCASHYSLQFYYEKRGERPQPVVSICEYPNCQTGTTHKSGLCSLHTSRMRRFGISKERLIELGSSNCMACGTAPGKRNLNIDHDHNHCAEGCSECIRGVLCHGCNVALGFLCDDPVRIQALKDYIESR